MLLLGSSILYCEADFGMLVFICGILVYTVQWEVLSCKPRFTLSGKLELVSFVNWLILITQYGILAMQLHLSIAVYCA